MQPNRPKTPKLAAPAPLQPTAPPTGNKRSLQINIDSAEDAKAVIQHLQKVKEAYDFAARNWNIDSVEFCIASDIRREVDPILMGAIRWCRTYTKQVSPFDGNVLFPLPHYREPALTQTVVATPPSAPLAAPIPATATNPEPSPLVKSKRPVRASDETSG